MNCSGTWGSFHVTNRPSLGIAFFGIHNCCHSSSPHICIPASSMKKKKTDEERFSSSLRTSLNVFRKLLLISQNQIICLHIATNIQEVEENGYEEAIKVLH